MIDFSARTFSPFLSLLDFVRKQYLTRPKIGSENSVTAYLNDTTMLLRFWAEVWCPAHQIAASPMRVMDYSEDLLSAAMTWRVQERGCTVNTANKFRRHHLAVWQYAADLSTLATRNNPRLPRIAPPTRVLVPPYTEPEIAPECWSLEELSRIFEQAESAKGWLSKHVRCGEWHIAHLRTVYNTGVRIDAIMRTPLANLDLRRGEVKVPAWAQKDKAEQRFDLLPETIAALKKLRLHERLPAEAPIFADWPYDRPGAWPALTRRLRSFVRGAGFECNRRDLFHKLRRTFATFLARDQGIVAAQQWLGHSHLSTTWKYIDKRYYEGPRLNGSLPEPRPTGTNVRATLRVFDGDAEVG